MRLIPTLIGLTIALVAATPASSGESVTYRVDRVVDGDTVRLRNGATVRLVQIDTPEVFLGTECHGRQASAAAPYFFDGC